MILNPKFVNLTALAVFFYILPSFADGVICYDKNNAFLISPPKGWVADFDSGHRFGLCVMFYLEGHTFHSSPAVVYPKIMGYTKKGEKGELDIQSFIDVDLAPFESKTGDKVKIKKDDDFMTPGTKMPFVMRRLLEGPSPNEFEAMAYHSAKEAVLFLVLTARNAEDFEHYEPLLKEFLNLTQPLSRTALFEELKSRAKKNVATPEGKKYESAFLRVLSEKLKTSTKACLGGEAGKPSVNAVLQISEKGTLLDWLNETDDSMSVCMKGKMTGSIGLKPPISPFHIFLEMKVK